MLRRVVIPLLYTVASLSWAQGHRSRIRSGALRKRVHVRPLVTEAGSADLEFDGVGSSGGAYSVPVRLRFTPQGDRWFLGRTEFSVSADAVTSAVGDGHRVTQTGDNITVNLATVWNPVRGFALAAGPQVTAYVRRDQSPRVGGVGIGRWTWGSGNDAGFNISWTGANSPSMSNPSSVLDFGAGYGRDFGSVTIFGNYSWERAAGMPQLHMLSAGLEWEINHRFSIDVSAQQTRGQPGVQILVCIAIGLKR